MYRVYFAPWEHRCPYALMHSRMNENDVGQERRQRKILGIESLITALCHELRTPRRSWDRLPSWGQSQFLVPE